MMSQLVTNVFYPSQLGVNCQVQNGLGVPSPVMHAPNDRIMQQGRLLQDTHRSENEAAESAYRRNFLEDSTMQGLLKLGGRLWNLPTIIL